MYLIRRVYNVKPGTARRAATLIKQQAAVYTDAGQRSEVQVYFNGGTLDGRRILEERTIEAMLHTQRVEDSRIQGLTWYAGARIRGREVWGHGGSDPGINTGIRLVPDEGIAAIVFINTWGGNPSQMTRRLLEEAPGL